MSLIDLKDILCPEVLYGVDTSVPNISKVVLKEIKPTKLTPITVHIPSHECIVFTLEHPRKGPQKSNYLKRTKEGIHQGCDYVIACLKGGVLHFVLIELKSNSTSGAHSQLWHSKPFIQYLIKLIKTHYPKCAITDYTIQFLLFSTNPAHQIKSTTSDNKIFKVQDSRGFEVWIGGNPNNFYLKNIIK